MPDLSRQQGAEIKIYFFEINFHPFIYLRMEYSTFAGDIKAGNLLLFL